MCCKCIAPPLHNVTGSIIHAYWCEWALKANKFDLSVIFPVCLQGGLVIGQILAIVLVPPRFFLDKAPTPLPL